ncbi:hypothetical protein [Microvirga aerophila]|uniref:YfhO family protein n=1 Tax=Microvirga aerophila TaxID=670291 RepID=A0A512BSK8_9HYPH|nr:hypothetical protein [Microvirga aerophila]GEO14986.1 hypothetical protein MAE02_26820 [Microvirga aerophila]
MADEQPAFSPVPASVRGHSSAGARETHAWPYLALLAAVFLVLSYPWFSGQVSIPWDAKAHFYPQLQFLSRSIHRGEWPWWNPYVFAGHPQIADPQSLIFSPAFLLLALILPEPSLVAADAAVFVLLFAGAGAIFLVARDRRWHPAAALLAALVFGFGGSAAWRIQHVGQIHSLAMWAIAWLCLSRSLDRTSLPWGVAAGVSVAAMLLGRDQVAYLGAWVLAGDAVAHLVTAWWRGQAVARLLAPLAATAVTALAIIIIPILMSAILAADSNRVVIDGEGAGRGSLHPAHLLTLAVPNLFGAAGPLRDHWGPPSPLWGASDLYLARNMAQLYIGVLPLAVLGAMAWRFPLWRHRDIRHIAVAALLVLLYALGRYTPVFSLAFEIMPGVSLFRRPADATFLLGPLLGLCVAYLLHRWITDETAPRASPTVALGLFAGAAGAALLVAVSRNRLDYALGPVVQALVLFSAALGVFLAARPLARWHAAAPAVLIAGFVTVDVAWNNGPNESTALPSGVFSVLGHNSRNETIAWLKTRVAEGRSETRQDRIELVGIDFHWPNASISHTLDHTLGYNPVRLRWYSDATGAGDHVALPSQRTFSPLFPSYRSTLAQMLGLRYIASGVPLHEIDGSLATAPLPLVARTTDAFIYENPNARPRVTFAFRAQTVTFDTLVRTGQWPSMDGETVLLEDPGLGRGTAATGPNSPSVRILSSSNTDVMIEAVSDTNGYVVLNDVWHPWWHARRGNEPVPVLRANVMFRAVAVPPGRHMVHFQFEPFQGLLEDLRSLAKGLPLHGCRLTASCRSDP